VHAGSTSNAGIVDMDMGMGLDGLDEEEMICLATETSLKEQNNPGKAENMNAERTRGGAMDGNATRLLISKAISTNELIQYCNGIVKEGKEAVVYHADGNDDINSESGGFDVAVKVFKHIQEFRGRSAHIDGDPRYYHFYRIRPRRFLLSGQKEALLK